MAILERDILVSFAPPRQSTLRALAEGLVLFLSLLLLLHLSLLDPEVVILSTGLIEIYITIYHYYN